LIVMFNTVILPGLPAPAKLAASALSLSGGGERT